MVNQISLQKGAATADPCDETVLFDEPHPSADPLFTDLSNFGSSFAGQTLILLVLTAEWGSESKDYERRVYIGITMGNFNVALKLMTMRIRNHKKNG